MDSAPASTNETASSAASSDNGVGALHPGTIYKLNGENLMYVRTERRPEHKTEEHLFVKTRGCAVFLSWLEELPEQAELFIDANGREQANEAGWVAEIEKHDKLLGFELLARACSWLPKDRANELRAEFQERRA